jgi:hypothetical protein
MALDKYEFMHGAALVQVVNDPAFTSLNKASDAYGHYVINEDRRLFMKYSTARSSRWQFTFHLDEIEAIRADMEDFPTYVGLVCGTDGVALLSGAELMELVGTCDADQPAVMVSRPRGGSYRVSCGDVQLPHTIRQNSFPRRLINLEI